MPNGKVEDAPTAKELTVSLIKVVINLYGKEWKCVIVVKIWSLNWFK